MSVKSDKESEQAVRNQDKKKKKDLNLFKKKKWTCEGEPLWRIYFNSRKKADLPRQDLEPSQEMYPYECYPLNILNRRRAQLLDQIQSSHFNPGDERKKIRIWRNMKADPEIDMSSFLKTESSPEVELAAAESWTTGKCIPYLDQVLGLGAIDLNIGDVDVDDYATCRELGHARVPAVCQATKKTHHIVDRSTGERPGLVDGDYVTCEFESKGDDRLVYTQVCLRGTKGMHLIELARERTKTWKFCFYQALVALYLEKGVKIRAMKRPELMKLTGDLGQEKKKLFFDKPVHEGTKEIEQWFDKLPDNCGNCVFRTGKFALTFWKDGSFWYLYNPYRCDKFGFWDDNGKASIIKFCSRVALRRHLMILLVRAYAYGVNGGDLEQREDNFGDLESEKIDVGNEGDGNVESEEVNLTNGEKELENVNDGVQENDEVNLENEENNLEGNNLEKNEDENKESDEKKLENEKNNLEKNEDDNPESDEKNLENEENVNDQKEIQDNDETVAEKDLVEDNILENVETGENLASDKKKEKNAEEIRKNDEINPENQEENTSIEENLYIKQRNQDNNSGNDKLTIQIFQLNYNCVKLHNLKLLCKNSSNSKTRPITKKIDEYDLSSSNLNSELVSSTEHIEKPSWLSENRITWSKVSSASPCRKSCWHEYLVEEPRKLFSLWGEIHPTGRMFSPENRGKQIYACYLVCLGMSRIMAPEYWSSKTLDTVVMCGDRYYASSRLQSDAALGNSIDNNNDQRNNADVDRARTSWESYLTRHFKIGDMLFEVKVLSAIYGRLYSRNSLWKILQQMFLTHSYGVLTCESSCLAIFKFCGAYYVFDTNSFGPPIFDYGRGVAYLLRATSFQKLLKTLILIVNSLESSRFSVNPVEILKIIDVESPCNKIKEKKLKKKLKRTKGCK
ncbi:hypothetical protein G9C98_007092 [Cotesia typhae]|uniref:Uncharacterized protein n=1 Tax=Cotesia typhae TaxID=2053667 RepID=A0A8J5QXE3_9HYME|nr:hypothetical protein G9C98_007092 [Cotesia typhae]